MNCFNHPNEPAVGTCVDCNKGLCQTCANQFSIPICANCNAKRIKNERNTIVRNILSILLIGGFLYFLTFNRAFSGVSPYYNILSFYVSCSLVAGWIFLNKITPQMFLVLPIIGWVIYFVFKLVISAFIGPFILPFVLYRDISRYVELKKITVS